MAERLCTERLARRLQALIHASFDRLEAVTLATALSARTFLDVYADLAHGTRLDDDDDDDDDGRLRAVVQELETAQARISTLEVTLAAVRRQYQAEWDAVSSLEGAGLQASLADTILYLAKSRAELKTRAESAEAALERELETAKAKARIDELVARAEKDGAL